MFAAISILIEVLFLTIIRPTGEYYIPDNLILLCILFTSIAVILDLEEMPEYKDTKDIIMLAFFLRLMVMFIDVYMKNTISVFGSGIDTEGFYRRMVRMAIDNNYIPQGNFPITFGYLFRLIGISRLYAQFLLVICSLVELVFFAKTVGIICVSVEKQRAAMLMISLLPVQLCLSVVLLRESIIYMFVSIGIYYFVKWYDIGDEISFVASIVFLMGAMIYHSGIIGVIIGVTVSRILFDTNSRKIKLTALGVAIGLTVILSVAYLYNNYGELLFAKFVGIDSIADISDGTSRGGSSYAKYVGDSSTVLRMVIYTGPRMIYFMFSPFPWQWRGLTDIIAFFFNSLIYLVIVVRGIGYIINTTDQSDTSIRRRQIIGLLLIICSTATFIFAWGTINSGTALRHRDKMSVIYCLIAAVLLDDNEEARTIGKEYGRYIKM